MPYTAGGLRIKKEQFISKRIKTAVTQRNEIGAASVPRWPPSTAEIACLAEACMSSVFKLEENGVLATEILEQLERLLPEGAPQKIFRRIVELLHNNRSKTRSYTRRLCEGASELFYQSEQQLKTKTYAHDYRAAEAVGINIDTLHLMTSSGNKTSDTVEYDADELIILTFDILLQMEWAVDSSDGYEPYIFLEGVEEPELARYSFAINRLFLGGTTETPTTRSKEQGTKEKVTTKSDPSPSLESEGSLGIPSLRYGSIYMDPSTGYSAIFTNPSLGYDSTFTDPEVISQVLTVQVQPFDIPGLRSNAQGISTNVGSGTHDREKTPEQQPSNYPLSTIRETIAEYNATKTPSPSLSTIRHTKYATKLDKHMRWFKRQQPVRQQWTNELIHALLKELRPYQIDCDSLVFLRICLVLPELLKDFALRVGAYDSSPVGTEIMLFVHHNRLRIQERFKILYHEDGFEALETKPPSEINARNDGTITVEDKVSLWHESLEASNPKGTQDLSPETEDFGTHAPKQHEDPQLAGMGYEVELGPAAIDPQLKYNGVGLPTILPSGTSVANYRGYNQLIYFGEEHDDYRGLYGPTERPTAEQPDSKDVKNSENDTLHFLVSGYETKNDQNRSSILAHLPTDARILSQASAFEWLLGNLRREIILTPTTLTPIEDIKYEITKRLPPSINNTSKRRSEIFGVVFIMDWYTLPFVYSQGYENKPRETIESAITITGSSGDAQALTCAQYLSQTWPVSGKHTLDLIKNVIESDAEFCTCTFPDNSRLKATLQKSSRLVVEVSGIADSVVEVGQQFAWLVATFSPANRAGATIRIPRIGYSDPTLRLTPLNLGLPSSSFLGTAHKASTSPNLYFEIYYVDVPDLETYRIPQTNGRCWLAIFEKVTIVDGYPISRRPALDAGLEIPLNMMAGLAQARHIQIFDEKLFIKGFSTLLFPTKVCENLINWHLICNQDGNRVSYTGIEQDLNVVEGLGVSDLEKSRHVLGWCSKSKYYAGAVDSKYDMKLSKLPNPHSGCILEGTRMFKRRLIHDRTPFSLGANNTPIHISPNGSLRKLKWIHEKLIVLWDEEAKRGWLVNGTSILLHLLRKSLEQESVSDLSSELCFKKEQIKEAKNTHDPSSSLKVLLNEDNMNLTIYEENEGPFCVRDRVEELFDSLEKLIDYQILNSNRTVKKSARKQLYLEGWDFTEIAMNRDLIYPRISKIHELGHSWVHWVHNIHAVTLFGRGFGEIIRPQLTTSCSQWTGLPKNNYYLAAAVKDLIMNVTDDMICHSSSTSIPDLDGNCECGGQEEATTHSNFAQMLLPQSIEVSPAGQPLCLDDIQGAVVFGYNEGLQSDSLQENPIDISEDQSILPWEESDHDSAVGSSIATRLSCEDYKVGIVCALPKELRAVRVLFDNRHDDLTYSPDDSNHYSFGSLHQHNVVAACLPSGEYGTCAAAEVFANMKRTFPKLEICLLVGIGGGVPSEKNDIRLGDVVVSHPTADHPGVIQYDLGKALEGGIFERVGSLQRPPRFILAAISSLKSDPNLHEVPLASYLDVITSNLPSYKSPGQQHDSLPFASPPRNHPKIHYGLIASGNKVMKDAKTRDQLGQKYNVLCFEMEAAGVMNAGNCLVIRGICDYSDSQKNDMWQEYAAATAAAYAKLLLSHTRIPGRSPSSREIETPTPQGVKRSLSSDVFNARARKSRRYQT